MMLPVVLLGMFTTFTIMAYLNMEKSTTEGRIMFWWLIGVFMVFGMGTSAIALVDAIIG